METFLENLGDSLNLGHMLFDLISVSFQPPCSSLPLSHLPVPHFPLIFHLLGMCCVLQNTAHDYLFLVLSIPHLLSFPHGQFLCIQQDSAQCDLF